MPEILYTYVEMYSFITIELSISVVLILATCPVIHPSSLRPTMISHPVVTPELPWLIKPFLVKSFKR